MERAMLEVMKLAGLRQLGAEKGIADALQLGRKALIEALFALEKPADELSQAEELPQAEELSPAEELPRAEESAASVPPTSKPAAPVKYDTVAMALMYLEQGAPARAVEIYLKLLIEDPDDIELQAGLAEAEHQLAAMQEHHAPGADVPPHHDEPMGMLDFEEPPEDYGVDEVEILFRDPYTIFAYWEITQHGIDAARVHLGNDGQQARLVLRVFSTVPGDQERSCRDLNLDGLRGRRYLPSPRPGVRLRAAIGLVCSSGLFSPIAHSSPVRVPPAQVEAYDPNGAEWMEVNPAPRGAKGPAPLKMRKLGQDEAPSIDKAIGGSETEATGDLPSSAAPSSPWRHRPGSGN